MTSGHPARTALSLAALATLALVVAGCSIAPAGTDSSAASGTNANREKGLEFAECMRNNGVSQFPDPDSSGTLTIENVVNGTSIDPNSPTFQQALTACRDLEPAGFMGPKRSAQQQQAALQFAQCMRDNGVKDFPDPTPDGPVIDTKQIPSAATAAGKSNLEAAMRKCRDFAAAAGVTGGR